MALTHLIMYHIYAWPKITNKAINTIHKDHTRNNFISVKHTIQKSYRPHMNLYIKRYSTRKILSNALSKINISFNSRLGFTNELTNHEIMVSSSQPNLCTCHNVSELSPMFLTTWYLSLCDLDNQWSKEISFTT